MEPLLVMMWVGSNREESGGHLQISPLRSLNPSRSNGAEESDEGLKYHSFKQ